MKPVQLKMARAAVGWGVRDLAERAGVTANTVTRIENGADAKQSTIEALQKALEAAGIIFIPENGEGPGVRLRKSAATAEELVKQISDIGQELAQSDQDAPVSPAKGMQLLEDAHKAEKAVKLKNKLIKLKKK